MIQKNNKDIILMRTNIKQRRDCFSIVVKKE